MDIKRMSRSVLFAWRGLVKARRDEQNFRIALMTAIPALALMILLDLSAAERGVVTLAVGLVLMVELINSVFERLADLLKPRLHHYVEDIKDVMAGSALIAVACSVAVGVVIFVPHLIALWRP